MPNRTKISFGGPTRCMTAVSGDVSGAFWSHRPKFNFWPRNVENWNKLESFFFLFSFWRMYRVDEWTTKINIYKLGVLWPFSMYWHQKKTYLWWQMGLLLQFDDFFRHMPKFRLLGKSFPTFPLGGVIIVALACSTVLSRWQCFHRKEALLSTIGRKMPRNIYNSSLVAPKLRQQQVSCWCAMLNSISATLYTK